MIDERLMIQNYPTEGEDWWVLRRVKHAPDGPSDAEHAAFLRTSRLVPQSDVEGPAGDWQDIATAIEQRQGERHKRAAIEPAAVGFLIWSPRQSGMMEPVLISDVAAGSLAADIRAKVGARA